MRTIKFEFVGRNKKFDEIVREAYTLEQLVNGGDVATFFHFQNDNCELLARREWTGLKDKNGVEIYEGDIVRFDPIDECIGQVKFGEWINTDRLDVGQTNISGWFILYDWRLGDGRIYTDRADSLAHYEVEVIGNIYENPELLK